MVIAWCEFSRCLPEPATNLLMRERAGRGHMRWLKAIQNDPEECSIERNHLDEIS